MDEEEKKMEELRSKEEDKKQKEEEEKRERTEYEEAAKIIRSMKAAGEKEFDMRIKFENEGLKSMTEIDTVVKESMGKIVLEEDQRSLLSYDVEPDFHGVLHLFVIIEVTSDPLIHLVKVDDPDRGESPQRYITSHETQQRYNTTNGLDTDRQLMNTRNRV